MREEIGEEISGVVVSTFFEVVQEAALKNRKTGPHKMKPWIQSVKLKKSLDFFRGGGER